MLVAEIYAGLDISRTSWYRVTHNIAVDMIAQLSKFKFEWKFCPELCPCDLQDSRGVCGHEEQACLRRFLQMTNMSRPFQFSAQLHHKLVCRTLNLVPPHCCCLREQHIQSAFQLSEECTLKRYGYLTTDVHGETWLSSYRTVTRPSKSYNNENHVYLLGVYSLVYKAV